MTSKEAIQVLKNHNNRKYELVNKRRYAVSVIEKDLEILEKLKRILEPTYKEICGTHFMILKTKKGNVIYEANYDITGNELIKEWLNNDR